MEIHVVYLRILYIHTHTHTHPNMNLQILVAIMDSRVAWHPYEYLDIWIIMLYLKSYRAYYDHNTFPNIIIPEVRLLSTRNKMNGF